MRSVLTTVFVLLCLGGIAQERTISGKVVDQEMKGIPFCVVKAKDYNIGTYCDENGAFSLAINTDSVKDVIFSCLGFERKEIPTDMLRSSPVTVDLKKAVAALNTVVITDQGKPRVGTLGSKSMKHIGECYQKYGDEIALFLNGDSTRKAIVKEVSVYITDEGIPNSKFRIHVYAKDSGTNLPAQELTDSNIIVSATRGNEWVTADLSNQKILIANGVYVSVEWISGFGNLNRPMMSAKHPDVHGYYGQVMGLALNNGIRYMAHRNTFAANRWGFDYKNRDYMRPMVYATYTYTK